MSGCQVLPGDLADIPPGPQLAHVLSGLELARLSGFDCVQVLKARYRQLNHDRAQLMTAMVEVGLCDVGPADGLARRTVPDEFSADEIRAALVLTRRAADAQFWLAHDLLTRLPAVHAAMDAGWLDEPRARVLSEWTAELTTEQARAICAALLSRASKLTTGQMIEQIKKMAIAIDPDWARRRYEGALAGGKVVSYRNPDGSANLSGYNLPLDRVAAASGHINALAKAVKHAGDPRPIDHIRAELFLGMTDGTYAGLDDAAILEHLRSTHETENEPDDDHNGPHHESGYSAADGVAQRAPAGAGMELRVRLTTLLGHDRYPGELVGWGPVHAELARDFVTTLTRGEWRFAITDEQGQLLHCGITRARPTGSPTRSACSRQIVELQIPAATLSELTSDPDALGSWGPVVTDLAHQHTNAQRHPTEDPTRRFPGAALRRLVEIRDRYCVMIGCRAPARTADKDHTRDHGHGGPTSDDNLGAVCRHDHRLKHEGGWQLHQPQPAHFHWTSRLGQVYLRRPPPVLESLPEPLARDRPPLPLLVPTDADWEGSEIWSEPPSESEPEPRPPEPDPSGDSPPF